MSDSPIRAFLGAFDALDIQSTVALFSPGGTLMNTIGEEATGLDQLRGVLEEFFVGLRATEHEVSAEWNPEPGVWIAELSASYELADFSRQGPYRRAVIARLNAGKIEQLRIYGAHESPLAAGGRPYEEVRGPRGWLPTL